jgi:hypothetical protein
MSSTNSTSPFAALAARNGSRAAAPHDKPAAAVNPAQPDQPTPQAEPAAAAGPAVTSPAEAVPQEVAPQIAPPANKTIHVLTSTGNPQFDAILAGCVGSVDQNKCFQVDPDYTRLSYLFTLAQGSSVPMTGGDADNEVVSQSDQLTARRAERGIEFTMTASAANALKINCVATSARGWDKLYQDVGGGVAAGAMGANMLNRERQMVANSVAAYLLSAGLPTWRVPVIYQTTAHEEDPQARPTTEADLLRQTAVASNINPDVTRLPKRAEPAGQQDLASQEVHAAVSIPQEWSSHKGALQLTVEGDIQVLASSAEEAAQVSTALLLLSREIPSLAVRLQLSASSIQAAQLLPPTDDGDFMDDDDTDRGYNLRNTP